MFKQVATYNNIQEYRETATDDIIKCINDVTDIKTFTVWANQKSWFTWEVYWLLNAWNTAFRAVDKACLRTASTNLSRGIRVAKRQYSKKIALCYSDGRDKQSL